MNLTYSVFVLMGIVHRDGSLNCMIITFLQFDSLTLIHWNISSKVDILNFIPEIVFLSSNLLPRHTLHLP